MRVIILFLASIGLATLLFLGWNYFGPGYALVPQNRTAQTAPGFTPVTEGQLLTPQAATQLPPGFAVVPPEKTVIVDKIPGPGEPFRLIEPGQQHAGKPGAAEKKRAHWPMDVAPGKPMAPIPGLFPAPRQK